MRGDRLRGNTDWPDDLIATRLLRPLAWIETANLSVSADLFVSLPEMDLSGNSCVEAIEPCPPLAHAAGELSMSIGCRREGEGPRTCAVSR